MAHAKVIVISLSTTEALGWELDQIRERRYLGKAIFIVPPAMSSEGSAVRRLARRGGLGLSEMTLPTGHQSGAESHKHLLACWSDGLESETVVYSSRLSELDYEVAIRLFIGRLSSDGPEG